MKEYLACDLGAESGRLMRGWLGEGRMGLEEVHRFANEPVKADSSLTWNIPGLFEQLKAGLRKCSGAHFASFSTDSWGVDYVLYRQDGTMIEPTHHYRDARTAEGVKRAYARLNWPMIFQETGIQFMPLNTLFQLAAESADRLRQASLLLGIGDAFNYMLSGKSWAEQSLASTTQLYNPRTRTWSDQLIEALELPRSIFPPIVPSGTCLGPVCPRISAETGLRETEVVATCSHDTGAAVVAVPAQGRNWAYLSSGTWSLMGVEIRLPIITDRCRELNFTNEIGYGRSVRLLKNIVGLWVVQECRRDWARAGRDYSYAELTELAAKAHPFGALINAADPRFVAPGNMLGKIAAFCGETKQPIPETPGAVIRCVLESLALLYRRTLREIEQLTGASVERLHIVGGGSKNALLNQLTANAIGRPVVCGPAEATAAGNILVQAMSMGDLKNLEQAREVVRSSYPPAILEPARDESWADASARLENWG